MPFLQRGDAQLHYEVTGQGDLAVYIPGLGGHTRGAGDQVLVGALAAIYRVVILDSRGAGQTIVPAGAATTFEEMADDVAAIIREVGGAPARVLGMSMGGVTALMLALRHPDLVHRLAVGVTLSRADDMHRSAFILDMQRQMIEAGLPQPLINRVNVLILLGESAFAHRELVDMLVSAPPDPHRQDAAGFALQTGALSELGTRLYDQLPNIATPTLVISSLEDVLVPAHYQDEIVQRMPNATLKQYPGGHIACLLPYNFPTFVQDVVTFWNAPDTFIA